MEEVSSTVRLPAVVRSMAFASFSPKPIARATTEEASGPERLFLGTAPMRFDLGFVLSDDGHRYARLSPNSRAFGHAGGGGSLGMADPEAGIDFGFTMNNMQGSIVSAGATPTMLIDAFYETISGYTKSAMCTPVPE